MMSPRAQRLIVIVALVSLVGVTVLSWLIN
ncbi:hypothetical protein BKA23_0467 [Rudaeicoccus suwonensis]|uniref:Uncharacterized protein n=1 Tax=Rudaeicoccus suwonensis TaxID=657409 RepID=A0A561E7W4_9MICO|nr:hypothetical protein BKA23_0467 [Rudaeicoccus suwonensis]